MRAMVNFCPNTGIENEIIKKIVSNYDPKKTWTSILVTNKFLISLGLESDYFVNHDNQKCNYTGISLINAKKINSSQNLHENYIIIDDKRIALNLNTKEDYELLGATWNFSVNFCFRTSWFWYCSCYLRYPYSSISSF